LRVAWPPQKGCAPWAPIAYSIWRKPTVAHWPAPFSSCPYSRTREYSADHLGAQISGQPDALASALVKISNAAHQIENHTAEQSPATAHMFIINPLSGVRMDNLFSTHPSTEIIVPK